MSLIILPNTGGTSATAIDTTIANGDTDTDYDITETDVVSGARNHYWRNTGGTTERGIGYTFDADTAVDYGIIARADWLLTKDTLTLKLKQNDGAAWSDHTTLKDPIAASDLLGPYTQDYVFGFTPNSGQKRGYGITGTTKGANNEAVKISKLYFSSSFTFGKNPSAQKKPYWERLSESEREIRPLDSDEEYETETRITLTWERITRAKAQAFRAIPQIFAWPFFLYEDDASNISVFESRLEHVIIEQYFEEARGADNINIVMTLRRLAHYD